MMCFSTWPAAGHDHRPASTRELPDARQKELVKQYCTACHTIERVQRAGGTQAGWQDRIGRMQRWGARLPPGEVAGLARYLAIALPPRARPAGTLAYFANLAVQEVREQDIQVTLKFAAHAMAPDRFALEILSAADCLLLSAGQRVRVFFPDNRGSPTPGVITSVKTGDAPRIVLQTVRPMAASGKLAVAEVTLKRGRHLAVANGAILTEGSNARVFVDDGVGGYEARHVALGIAGDSETAVTAGLRAGDKVVTLGAFFVDAERRLDN